MNIINSSNVEHKYRVREIESVHLSYAVRISVRQYYVRLIPRPDAYLQNIAETEKGVAWQAVAELAASMHLFVLKK